LKKLFISIAILISPLLAFSQTTYDCQFQFGDRYNTNSIQTVSFEYTTGVSGIKKINHVSRNYVYHFETNYENGFLESTLTVFDLDNLSEDSYLYFSSSDTQGKPNYFYIDLISPKIAIDCECERK
jgi:hypothetical protein